MAVDWTGIRERYAQTAPLELLDQLRDTDEADELVLRSWAFGSIGRSAESLRDLERAAVGLGPELVAIDWRSVRSLGIAASCLVP